MFLFLYIYTKKQPLNPTIYLKQNSLFFVFFLTRVFNGRLTLASELSISANEISELINLIPLKNCTKK